MPRLVFLASKQKLFAVNTMHGVDGIVQYSNNSLLRTVQNQAFERFPFAFCNV